MKAIKNLFVIAVICLLLSILPTGHLFSQIFTRIDTSIVCSVEGFTHIACWGDYNNDGFEDLVIINGTGNSGSNVQFLFINEGEWRFKQIKDNPVFAEPSDYGSFGASWGDYDNDGHLDLFIAGFSNANNMLFRNNGDGTFTQITDGTIVNDGGDSANSNWVDIDNDGYLDLYVTNRRSQKNLLYRNNGNGTFTKITSGLLPNHIVTDVDLGSSWADYDNDGDPDLFDVGLGDGQRYFFINDGYGNFALDTESGLTEAGEKSWSWFPPSWGDYDNDSYTDVFFTNYAISSWASAKDFLFHNSGDGSFERKADLTPVNYNSEHDGGYWADLNNDGYLDLIISTYWTNETKIYWNNGDGSFTAGSGLFSANYGGCISIADINKDGFLDMFVGRGFYGSFKNAIFANNGNSNNWINIKLNGTVSNASAIGSKVSVKATIGGKPVWQVRETGLNQHSKNAHFGLGDATIIDSLVVQWPAGHDTILTNIDTNQFMTITELIPPGFLKASFTTDTLSGKGNVTVKFTDISRFDPGRPITSWSWDFDNDGTEDSNEQNPSHTFSSPNGSIYDVALKVSNGTDTSVFLKRDFIHLMKLHAEAEDDLTDRIIAPATSSSVGGQLDLANNAIDNILATRWTSQLKNDPEWLKIELDTIYNVGKVIIYWQTAYAIEYRILTSQDNETWDTVFCEFEGEGKEDTVYFTGIDARYVQIMGLSRKASNYSIYEVEIYQSDGNVYDCNCDNPPSVIFQTELSESVAVYPNPMSDLVTFSFNLQTAADIQLVLYDMTGRRIAEVYNGNRNAGHQIITWDRGNLASGTYFYEMKIASFHQIQRLNGKLLVLGSR